jgi:putative endonuclease
MTTNTYAPVLTRPVQIAQTASSIESLERLMDPMPISPRELGRRGEDHAAQYLVDLGWQIVDRNYHTRFGELDIVALDPERTLIFVEVKTRRSTYTGTPLEAVTPAKQRHLRRAALDWLAAHKPHVENVRFDVCAISAARYTDDFVVENFTHIRGAF